jgi:hypothetical protein
MPGLCHLLLLLTREVCVHAVGNAAARSRLKR